MNKHGCRLPVQFISPYPAVIFCSAQSLGQLLRDYQQIVGYGDKEAVFKNLFPFFLLLDSFTESLFSILRKQEILATSCYIVSIWISWNKSKLHVKFHGIEIHFLMVVILYDTFGYSEDGLFAYYQSPPRLQKMKAQAKNFFSFGNQIPPT